MLKIFTKYHGTSCKVSISFSLSYTKAYEIGWKGKTFKDLEKIWNWIESLPSHQFSSALDGGYSSCAAVPGEDWWFCQEAESRSRKRLVCLWPMVSWCVSLLCLGVFFSFWFLDCHVVNYWVDFSNWLIILQTWDSVDIAQFSPRARSQLEGFLRGIFFHFNSCFGITTIILLLIWRRN